MAPADQGLDTLQAACLEIHLGLVIQHELFLFDGALELILQRQPGSQLPGLPAVVSESS
jgi:hypothetical protein